MLPPKKKLPSEQDALTATFAGLNPENRASLQAFAEFLLQRQGGAEVEKAVPDEPLPIDRPPQETVVVAIRRLADTYPMLNRDELLHDASGVMTSHVLHGKAASEAIDELEALFASAYQRYADAQTK